VSEDFPESPSGTLLSRLIVFTTGHAGLMLFAAGLLVVVGGVALSRLPMDAFPDTTPVMVQVNTSAPGWAPDEVERQITFPIERELAGLAGLIEVRSISKFGLSQVNLIFADDIDIYLARQQTTERVIGVSLPEGRPHRGANRPRLGGQTAAPVRTRGRRGQ